ncbi:MAG: VWA domain-containing protein [Crocinitomicaceae bacterium]|nr:VWA domain-containing protein [Crocinitomicaceae bacterium]
MINWVGYTGCDFLEPQLLLLLCAVPFLIFFLLRSERLKTSGIKYTQSIKVQQKIKSSFVRRLRLFLLALKVMVFILLVIAISRPFSWTDFNNGDTLNRNGIEVNFVLDVSESMQAMDLEPNRLSAAKNVIEKFVNSRKGDRIGLVTYSGEAYTVCPRTIDHNLLLTQLRKANGNDLLPGTAIGIGLGTAVAQMKGDSTESKAIILLTDGTNNSGDLSPEDAANLAKSENIRVYTIGVGTNGMAPMPGNSLFGIGKFYAPVEIDEAILKNIAELTKAKYFRATNSESLKDILTEIDKIEKKRIKDSTDIKASIPIPKNLLSLLIILLVFLLISDLILFKVHE